MPPTLADRVFHILEAIGDIERGTKGVNFDKFADDRMLRAAVERLLEIICEATRAIPAEVKAAETSIAWQKLVGFGNQLRHAYHQTDAKIVWRIIGDDLPTLKAFAERILSKPDE